MASKFNEPESDMDTAVINMLLKPHELQQIPKIKVLNKDVQFKPVCKRNTTYIVAVVLLNDKDQICLVQEAKASCKNKWYLPAGRMEPNESLNGAVRRECKEEAGYEIDPLCLTCVEVGSVGMWFRFTFIARIIGGSLKSLEQADSESLQANWFSIQHILSEEFRKNIRSSDMLNIIQLAYDHYKLLCTTSFNQTHKDLQMPTILPVEISNEYIQFTYFLVDVTNGSYLVYSRSDGEKIPSVKIDQDMQKRGLNCFGHALESILVKTCFKHPDSIMYETIGVCTISYTGSRTSSKEIQDGIQMIVLLNIMPKNQCQSSTLPNQSFKWKNFKDLRTCTGSLVEQINTKFKEKFSFINLVIH